LPTPVCCALLRIAEIATEASPRRPGSGFFTHITGKE
jgi:hypothetical protein